MLKVRDKSLRPICRINVAGLAAVMFALVAMFLGPRLLVIFGGPGPSVDLAHTTHDQDLRDALREDAMVVAVQRDGVVFFASDKVAPELLPARIQAALHAGAHDTVYLKADARSKYGRTREVVDQVHSAGINKIAILTDHGPGRSAATAATFPRSDQ